MQQVYELDKRQHQGASPLRCKTSFQRRKGPTTFVSRSLLPLSLHPLTALATNKLPSCCCCCFSSCHPYLSPSIPGLTFLGCFSTGWCPDTLQRAAALGEAVAQERRSGLRRFRSSFLSPKPPGPVAIQLWTAESDRGGALLQTGPGC
jgi:hypothetical protein